MACQEDRRLAFPKLVSILQRGHLTSISLLSRINLATVIIVPVRNKTTIYTGWRGLSGLDNSIKKIAM